VAEWDWRSCAQSRTRSKTTPLRCAFRGAARKRRHPRRPGQEPGLESPQPRTNVCAAPRCQLPRRSRRGLSLALRRKCLESGSLPCVRVRDLGHTMPGWVLVDPRVGSSRSSCTHLCCGVRSGAGAGRHQTPDTVSGLAVLPAISTGRRLTWLPVRSQKKSRDSEGCRPCPSAQKA
jgi:hypothetical protein